MFAARRGRPYVAGEPDYWELTVETPSASATWIVNIAIGSSLNIDIDWGDGGSVENFTTTGQKSHTYTNAGTYTVKISGSGTDVNIRLGTTATDRPYLKATSVVGGITGIAASGFRETFRGCTGLTSLPVDLFRYNTAVSTSGFLSTFYGCTGLTSLPVDLFRYNTAVSTSGFYQTFFGCTGLTSLPADLFLYNTAVSTSGFLSTFYGCTGLTSLPVDLFRYNTAVSTSGFSETFRGCTGLETVPALLFKYNTLCTGFFRTFFNCNKLQLRADLFWDPAGDNEHLTRFLNQSVFFQETMRIGTFTGTQGTAPALWTVDFGTGTPTKTSCFTGHTTSSISNHADVVADGTWGLS
jgi:hypothetical protein